MKKYKIIYESQYIEKIFYNKLPFNIKSDLKSVKSINDLVNDLSDELLYPYIYILKTKRGFI